MVIPWYLILGRPYPIQVYIYACEQYSANPNRGQRWAAEITRAKFKLKTFSHTTLGRAFKSIEKSQKMALESRYGDEFTVDADENHLDVSGVKCVITTDEQKTMSVERRFHSVNDTKTRRQEMYKFLALYRKAIMDVGFEKAVWIFVKYWYDKTKRLLL